MVCCAAATPLRPTSSASEERICTIYSWMREMRREVIADSPDRLLVLIERHANRRSKSFLAAGRTADGCRDGAELFEHFALEKRRRVSYAEAFEGALGKVAQHDSRVLVEIIERRRSRWRRCDASPAIAFRRFP